MGEEGRGGGGGGWGERGVGLRLRGHCRAFLFGFCFALLRSAGRDRSCRHICVPWQQGCFRIELVRAELPVPPLGSPLCSRWAHTHVRPVGTGSTRAPPRAVFVCWARDRFLCFAPALKMSPSPASSAGRKTSRTALLSLGAPQEAGTSPARGRAQAGGAGARGGGLLCPMMREPTRIQLVGLRCSGTASHLLCPPF